MRLTPLEIRKQEFRRTMRGLDPVEVQTFLEMVAEQYEELLEENKRLSHQQIELQTKLKDYQENEKSLKETLLNVQEVKKQSEESSKRQADLTVKEAELKALEILEDARKQARQMREEIDWLRSQKESFINRLRHILVSQIELLSVMEIDDLIPKDKQELLKAARSRMHLKPVFKNEEADESEEKGRQLPDERRTDASKKKTGTSNDENLKSNEDENRTDTAESLANRSSHSDQPSSEISAEGTLTDEEINNFFKKGIQIDELIKTLNRKDKDK